MIHFYEEEKQELYNLRDDQGETIDVAEKNPEKLIQLRKELFTFLTEMNARLPEKIRTTARNIRKNILKKQGMNTCRGRKNSG